MAPDWNSRTLRSASPQHERYWQQQLRPLLLFSAILQGGPVKTQHKTAIVVRLGCRLRARPFATRASARSLASERTYPRVYDCGPADLYPMGTRMVVSERLLGTVAGGRVGAPAGPPPARPNQGTGSTSCAFSCGAPSSSSVSQPSFSWRQHCVWIAIVPIVSLTAQVSLRGPLHGQAGTACTAIGHS